MDKKINQILKLLSINEYNIIGSKADPNIKDEVISDIDAQEITFTTYEDILKHFQNIFKILKKSKYIIITDFKSGYNHLTEQPYRWDYKTIMDGFQYDTEGNKIDFIETLKIKSIIKIDTIIYYNKEFIEMTLNYYFSFPNHSKTYEKKSNNEVSKELKSKDIPNEKTNMNDVSNVILNIVSNVIKDAKEITNNIVNNIVSIKDTIIGEKEVANNKNINNKIDKITDKITDTIIKNSTIVD